MSFDRSGEIVLVAGANLGPGHATERERGADGEPSRAVCDRPPAP